jgi:hypothetical protein
MSQWERYKLWMDEITRVLVELKRDSLAEKSGSETRDVLGQEHKRRIG